MKIDFQYATDFLGMNGSGLSRTCMHLLCTAGEGSFVFNERCYHLEKNDLVVMPNPTRAKNLTASGVASALTRTPSSSSTTARQRSYWRTSIVCATASTTDTCSSTER